MTKLYEKLLKLWNRAVKKAQKNNHKNGIPNLTEIDLSEKICYIERKLLY